MVAKKSLKILNLLGFLFALSVAFPAYIRSTFLEEFVALRWIGLFFIGSAVLSLVAINFFPYFIKKFTNYRLSLIVIIIDIVSILLLISTRSPYWAFVFFTFAVVATYLIWISLDVFVEKLTANITTGRTRTIYLTFTNLGWVLSPLAVGYLVGEKNYRLIYFIAVLFLLSIFIILLAKRKSLEDHVVYKHHHTLRTLKNIWRNLNLRGIFAIAFLLELFYAIAVIYMPIYLHQDLGFDWSVIGIIFTFMLLPFIILEIPAGVLADKYAGEKKIFCLGFIILVTAVALFFFVNSTNPIVWGLILFISRCGAALIEAMRESYFFKIVDVEDIDYINFFRNISPLSYLIGSALAILILEFYPIQYLFIFLAVILLSGFYFTWRIKAVSKKSLNVKK